MTKAKQLKQDKRNYRKHSERNKELIRKSIDEAGFGRSVVVDADDVLVCGNGVQSVIDPDTPTRIIETDGSELIVVKRTDLHEGDERRNRLAMADNATADHVEWDMEMLAQDFDMEEIGRFDIEFDFGEDVNPDDFGDEFSLPEGDKPPFKNWTFTLANEQYALVEEAVKKIKQTEEFKAMDTEVNSNGNGNAIYLIVKQWEELKKLS